MTDSIADMLTRIRNSMQVGRRTVSVPHSKMRVNTLEVMKDNGFIKDFKVIESKPQSLINVTIAGEDEPFVITNMKRESRPGRRMYVKAQDIPKVMNGRGIAVVSTSKGIMTGQDARSQGIGGELICSMY